MVLDSSARNNYLLSTMSNGKRTVLHVAGCGTWNAPTAVENGARVVEMRQLLRTLQNAHCVSVCLLVFVSFSFGSKCVAAMCMCVFVCVWVCLCVPRVFFSCFVFLFPCSLLFLCIFFSFLFLFEFLTDLCTVHIVDCVPS